MIDVVIGVQIRNGSTRLPGKSGKIIDGTPIYRHMVENVYRCINFIKKHQSKNSLSVKFYFLVPYDEFDFWAARSVEFSDDMKVHVICGEEDLNGNVFCRYDKMFMKEHPQYIVRLTGDCPFIPSALINKAISCATSYHIDYVSNVDPRYRTMQDGFDVEVISATAWSWLRSQVKEFELTDFEHVTTYLRQNTPHWMRCASISSILDLSDFKYSIDTKSDLDEVERRYVAKVKKDSLAKDDGLFVYDF
jgi:spore coat polysaccharide biosynthesis protein SpsF (cytidylyltransferase family)